jgi:hypothetical protein
MAFNNFGRNQYMPLQNKNPMIPRQWATIAKHTVSD